MSTYFPMTTKAKACQSGKAAITVSYWLSKGEQYTEQGLTHMMQLILITV